MIQIEISPGELVDRYTILKTKYSKIHDRKKRANVEHAWAHITTAVSAFAESRTWKGNEVLAMSGLQEELQVINDAIWLSTEDFRAEPSLMQAQALQDMNDDRLRIKREINELCGYTLLEEKSYV